MSGAALRRLRSVDAVRYDDGPTITVLHRSPSGSKISTTGRLIAETSHEIALLVRGTPTVISLRRIVRRSDRVETVTASA